MKLSHAEPWRGSFNSATVITSGAPTPPIASLPLLLCPLVCPHVALLLLIHSSGDDVCLAFKINKYTRLDCDALQQRRTKQSPPPPHPCLPLSSFVSFLPVAFLSPLPFHYLLPEFILLPRQVRRELNGHGEVRGSRGVCSDRVMLTRQRQTGWIVS